MTRPGALPKSPEDAMRTLLDLAIERIHGAGMGDLSWNEALAAVARVHAAAGAILQTPELLPEEGGLWAFHESGRARAGPLHAVPDEPPPARAQQVYSSFLADGGDRAMPKTLFVLLAPPAGATGLETSEALELTSRHLALAVRLWFRNGAARHGAEALAESTTAACVLVNRTSRVLWMNRRANEWARAGRLAVSKGQLRDIAGFGFDVAAAVRECLSHRCARVELAADRTATLEMRSVPTPRIHDDDNDESGSILIAIREQAPGDVAAATLARVYQVTPSEAELVVALSRGTPLADYAERRGVAVSTVRSQVKSLLAKTGCRRQSELIALVGRIQPVLDLTGGLHYAAHDKSHGGRPQNGR